MLIHLSKLLEFEESLLDSGVREEPPLFSVYLCNSRHRTIQTFEHYCCTLTMTRYIYLHVLAS
jgi:hypothetical protein